MRILNPAASYHYVGAISLGFNPACRRIWCKVTGGTKAEARDELREQHREAGADPAALDRQLPP